MPLDPTTWTDGNFLSASILNNDLYTYGGAYFTPNGIRFHTQRPLYKGAVTTANPTAITAGNWGLVCGNTQGNCLISIDSGNLYGFPLDPAARMRLTGNVRGAGGGNLNGATTRANGGLYLMSAFNWCSGSAPTGAGLGPPTASTPTNLGTRIGGNSVHNGSVFIIDIVDSAVQTWAPFILNGGSSGTVTAVGTQADLSGQGSRLGAHWISTYEAFGATVGTAPAPLASWTGQSLNAALLNGNTGLHDVLRFFNMPPFARVENDTPSQSLSASTVTTITLGSLGAGDYDSYNGYASNTYTVPFSGLYFVHGIVGFQNFSGACQAGVQINGTNYFGPGSSMPANGQGTCTKTQIFSLNAGDTIRLVAQTTAASSIASNWPPRLIVHWLSGQGTPSALPTLPDVTYRWTAGTPADVSALMNAHIANDLILLTQKPYLMAYQTAAQTGIAMGTPTVLSLDTVKGQVHADNGDNYSGWSSGSNSYTAQRSGWYLAVTENSLIFPTLTTSPIVAANFGLSVPGNIFSTDSYGQNNSASSGYHPGATGVGYYYLRAGDSIKAYVFTQDSSSTTTSTATGSNATSHFELVWISE